MIRRCKVCGETKPISAFGLTYRKPGARRHQCKTCRNAYNWRLDKAKLPPSTKPKGDIRHLAGHVPAPVMETAVLAKVRELGAPFHLREIYQTFGMPKHTVQRVLGRLVKKGILTRWKVPASTRTRRGTTTIQMYLYALNEGQ